MRSGLVSVVVPVYNGERWLREAIDSVLSQSYSARELVAVDDGSTDGSADLLASYGSAIRVIRQSNSGSVGLARNAGIAQAAGEFIAFLDQDDFWHSAKLTLQVDTMRSDAAVGLVHTGVTKIGDHGDPSSGEVGESVGLHGYCFDQLLMGNGVCNSSALVRRQAIDAVGMCDPRVEGNTVQDYDLWLRIASKYAFGFIPQKLTFYRIHHSQGSANRRAMLQAEFELLSRMRPLHQWRDGAEGRRRIAQLCDELAVSYLDAGDIANARHHFGEALRIDRRIGRLLRKSASHLPLPLLDRLRGRFGIDVRDADMSFRTDALTSAPADSRLQSDG